MTTRAEVGSNATSLSEEIYAQIFDTHFWGLVRLARLLGADDPEDVTQEAFVRLHRRLHTLRDPQAALPYLRATVCNLTRKRVRHLITVRNRQPDLMVDIEGASAEAAIVHKESVQELLAALTQLPRRQREVVVLRYWAELTERETAETLGIAVGTVKSHTARAIAALTTMLEEQE
jgi:RNA polymerase sigma-70 factor (sigma-E family)